MDRNSGGVGRRTFLAVGVSLGLAGCVSDDSGSPDDSTTARQRVVEESAGGSTVVQAPSSTPTTTGTDGEVGDFVQIESERTEPQATATIGSGESLAGFSVWNDAGTTRRIAITVRKQGSDTVSFEETYRLEPDAYVDVDISTAGDYVVGVGLADEAPEPIDFTVDDCNEQGLSVVVRSSGEVESSSMSTLALCMSVAQDPAG